MIGKLKALYAKYGDILRYLIIGGVTTLIDLAAFALLETTGMNYLVAKSIAWVLAVAFAFWGNKQIVFRTETRDARGVAKEAGSFLAMRLITLGISLGFMYIAVDLLGWNENLSNLICNIVVIILNYILSKLIVFRKKDDPKKDGAA